jgi:hypothetical protein
VQNQCLLVCLPAIESAMIALVVTAAMMFYYLKLIEAGAIKMPL